METIFQSCKRAKTSIFGGFYPKIELDVYFMITYPLIKDESKTLIISKDTEPKPFFEVEKGQTALIIGGFNPKSTLTFILLLYTCVLNMNPIH